MDKNTVEFLIRAKKATYAGKGAESAPSRPESHDLAYAEGDLAYIDTYLGGERFAGEEALWKNGKPFWSMNYIGRVTGEGFSGDFLKAALLRVPSDKPYTCEVSGSFEWFQGKETISLNGKQIYDCYFHGGTIK